MSDSQFKLNCLNVLVLDDNQHMRTLIETILLALGVRNIHKTSDVKQAFGDLQYFSPDIVITDWQMEPLNGLDFVRMVRSRDDSPTPAVPIIMLTGHSELQRVYEARDAGVNEFLAKPVSVQTMCSRLISLIEYPRPFIRTTNYFGPCRRRRDEGPPHGVKERRTDGLGKHQEEYPNLKAKIGRGWVKPDVQDIQRAEKAIKKIGSEFPKWAQESFDDMGEALSAVRQNPERQEDYIAQIFQRSTELKGHGGQFEFDLISQVSDSLKRFTGSRREASPRDAIIIEAHINAMRVIIIEGTKGNDSEVGRNIVDSLYELTSKSE